ncbi:MAG: hypothetical protein C5B52_11640 [Bacteroidetes bacterium]|nr:MAG: hypothetical protein C5B52_11640 [Bacteroidota bacterium]
MTDYLLELEKPKVIYATFWLRLFALTVDAILIIVVNRILSYFTIQFGNNVVLIFSTFFFGILYKIILEYKLGATIGKLTFRIRVVNLKLNPPVLKEVLLRNIFGILYSILAYANSLQYYLMNYVNASDPNNGPVLSNMRILGMYIVGVFLILSFIEALYLVSDDRKRSLHDRIAGTLVIKRD